MGGWRGGDGVGRGGGHECELRVADKSWFSVYKHSVYTTVLINTHIYALLNNVVSECPYKHRLLCFQVVCLGP